ncbi:hypothetical protein QWJ90_06340 [Microbacterium oryzae]|uniref:hypothetical protein n=1 Tax=Microbacterium oryzae TaxID=743009 RepID=UPI0025B24FF7|nr:hypothetical protein [Microbacterium oryzae]MDN3310543.1 hypothetical protein [Microbacterium oryzae]
MSDINISVYHQHLSQAVEAVVIGLDPERPYGYATLKGTRENPELEMHSFPDLGSMRRALSETFNGRLLSDLYPDVYRFGPDKPLRMHLVIEDDDEGEQ